MSPSIGRRDRSAVVIGAGPNGLVAANLLADAGWQVLVLEEQARPGGAVASDTDVEPSFVHDTFSSFYPLAAASRTMARLGLERYGLVWTHAPAVLGHPLPDGRWAVLERTPEATAAGLESLHPGDGASWLAVCDEWRRIGGSLVAALLDPFPPVRAGLGMLTKLPRAGGLSWVRDLVAPVLDLAERRFAGDGARLLLVGNALHADAPLTGPVSGVFGLLMCMLGQSTGFPVPVGGAGRLTDALVARLAERGGEIRVGSPVTRILTERRRVHGVEIAGSERLPTSVVVADVSAPFLYDTLLADAELPHRVRAGMSRFRWDPATVKVDWALDGPVPWTGAPPRSPGTVHVGDSPDALLLAQAQVEAHLVPERPFLLLGQMTTTDPTRSPVGTESLWAYTRVPQRVRGDAGRDGLTGRWDDAELARMADRVQAEIERRAPGFGALVRARRVLGPQQLECRDRNLVGGATGGGTQGLQQQLVFRPVPGLGRAETTVRGVFLGSAAAHPGGGVHGAPGANAARAVLVAARLGRI